jgi:hypothetical protein
MYWQYAPYEKEQLEGKMIDGEIKKEYKIVTIIIASAMAHTYVIKYSTADCPANFTLGKNLSAIYSDLLIDIYNQHTNIKIYIIL